MNRTTRFIIEVVTDDRIDSDIEKDEMAQNIANALVSECTDGDGITPEDSETFTKIIYVKEWYSDNQFIEHP